MPIVLEFKSEYRHGKAPVDSVLLAPRGVAQRSTQTWTRVNELKPPEYIENPEAPKMRFIVGRWREIEPAYEAWRKGQALPETGTPLAAWSALTPGQVEQLKSIHIRTVEDVAAMTASSIAELRWPDANRYPDLAKRFLSSVPQAESEQRISELEDRLAALAELAEEQQLKLQENTAEEPKPKRRGRPPKPKPELADADENHDAA